MARSIRPRKKPIRVAPSFVSTAAQASEKIMDLTPDGRPGLARVLASQGFKALALTYPGHYPPGVFGSSRYRSANRFICLTATYPTVKFSIAI